MGWPPGRPGRGPGTCTRAPTAPWRRPRRRWKTLSPIAFRGCTSGPGESTSPGSRRRPAVTALRERGRRTASRSSGSSAGWRRRSTSNGCARWPRRDDLQLVDRRRRRRPGQARNRSALSCFHRRAVRPRAGRGVCQHGRVRPSRRARDVLPGRAGGDGVRPAGDRTRRRRTARSGDADAHRTTVAVSTSSRAAVAGRRPSDRRAAALLRRPRGAACWAAPGRRSATSCSATTRRSRAPPEGCGRRCSHAACHSAPPVPGPDHDASPPSSCVDAHGSDVVGGLRRRSALRQLGDRLPLLPRS